MDRLRPLRASGWSYPAVVLGTLTLYNVVVNEALPRPWHYLAAPLAAAWLVWWARRNGATWDDLGLVSRGALSSARTGLVFGVGLVAVLAVAAALPATRGGFDDAELVGVTAATAAWEVGVRIPIVTAAFEELAFRGVLLASLTTSLERRPAAAVHAVVFGLWHVLPTTDPGVGTGPVVTAVLFTAVAGLLFAEIRLRTGSLAGPFVLHTMANGAGYVVAWWVANAAG